MEDTEKMAESYQMGLIYGKAYRIMQGALWREGQDYSPYEIGKMMSRPGEGFAIANSRAFRSRALRQSDIDIIAAYMDGVESPDWWADGYDADQYACGVGIGMHQAHTVLAAEASRMLGVTRGRVTQMIDEGKLDAIKVKGHVYITQGSIERIKRSDSEDNIE